MASSLLHLEIISPEGIVYQGDVEEVILPTTTGEIAILPNHAPLFSKVSDGEIKIKKGENFTSVAIMDGFVEVGKNNVNIISDYAVKAESIEIARAEEAKRRAEQSLKEREGKQEFVEIEKELKKSLLELKVADKLRKRQQR